MLYFLVILFFTLVFFLVHTILTSLNKDKIKIENRVEQVMNMNLEKGENLDSISFSERAIKPLYENISRLILKITPRNEIVSINKRLERAGLLKDNTAEKWMCTKGIISFIICLLTGMLTYAATVSFIKALFISIVFLVFINVLFNFYLSVKITNRKKQILKELPFTLDLITVSVEAGLSFDGAMVRVINNMSGELCDEFAKSLKEIRMGIQRKTALRNMSERCEVKELSMLITSLIQADEIGISLGKVLRIEASNLREHRKQLAREKAMKAPVKMLFPLIFFIFPSIFIIILGPAIIKISKIF